MPAFLTVLPVFFLAENPELARTHRPAAEEFRAREVASLGVSGPFQEVKTGGFAGARIHPWNEPYSAVLHTAFVFAAGATHGAEFARVTTLVRAEDCVHLGSRWFLSATTGAPTGLAPLATPLSDMRRRAFARRSTIRLDTRFEGRFADQATLLFDAMGAERLAQRGLPVDSSVARLACKWNPPRQQPITPVTRYPARAHRVVSGRYRLSFAPGGSWPLMSGASHLVSGLFGEKSVELARISPAATFHPQVVLDTLVPAVEKQLHDVDADTFRVLKRTGRWVYLDRGRAYGLAIGTHLVGPKGERLHVIHYAPGDGGPDVAVALVRTENVENPLRPSDVIGFDPTTYPLSPWASPANSR